MASSSGNGGGVAKQKSQHPFVLVVDVLHARGLGLDLESLNSNSTRKFHDPFVQVLFSGQDFRTRVEHGSTGTASWDERVQFSCSKQQPTALTFKICEKKRLSKKLLGMGVVSAQELLNLRASLYNSSVVNNESRSVTQWLKLTDSYGTAGDFGELCVSYRWICDSNISGKTAAAVLNSIGMKYKRRGENVPYTEEITESLTNSGAEIASIHDLNELYGIESDVDVDEEDETEEIKDSASKGNDNSISEDDEEENQKQKMKNEEEEERIRGAASIQIKTGDWQVIFHVIEVRELKSEDLNGLSDPVCKMEIVRPLQKSISRWSKTKKACKSAVFDEKFFLTLKNADKDMLETTSVKFSVFDADTFTSNDLIGSYTFDFLSIYYQKAHTYKKQWIGLIDEKNPKDKGIQGYAKVSVTVLGPSDTAAIGADDEDENPKADEKDVADPDLSEALVLLPPNVKQELHFLRVRIYQMEDLPILDHGGLNKVGIDAYAKILFAGNPKCKTAIVTKTAKLGETRINCVFNEELSLPTWTHSLVKNIVISIWDDNFGKNKLVGVLNLDYESVWKSTKKWPKVGVVPPRWYPIYGAPPELRNYNKAAKQMNKNPNSGSAYRGRVLISLVDQIDSEDSKEVETVHKKHIRAIRRRFIPINTTYISKLWAISASEMPKLQSHFGVKTSASLAIGLSIGPHSQRTRAVPVRNGKCYWGEALQLEVQLPCELQLRWQSIHVQNLVKQYDQAISELKTVKRNVPEILSRTMSLESIKPEHDSNEGGIDDIIGRNPVDAFSLALEKVSSLEALILSELEDCQVPDIFLYVSDRKGRNVSFARFKPGKLLLERFKGPLRWVDMQEDKARNLLDDDDYPGCVQVQLGFGCGDENEDLEMEPDYMARWDSSKLTAISQENMKPHYVRVNVYQGSDIPASDPDGLTDPYAKVYCEGQMKEITKRRRTCDPQWYETVEFKVNLPELPEFAPNVSIKIFDYDKYSQDDYLGSTRISLTTKDEFSDNNRVVYCTETNSKPTWNKLFRVQPGDCQGAILTSVSVSTEPMPPIGSILPVGNPATLELVVLGVRQLEAYKNIPIQFPRIRAHLGDASKTKNTYSTKRSKTPSGADANFGETLEIPFTLPEDLVFLPRLHIFVEDSLFGGLKTPIVATGTIDIANKVPGSPLYVKPGKPFHLPKPTTKIQKRHMTDHTEEEAQCLLGDFPDDNTALDLELGLDGESSEIKAQNGNGKQRENDKDESEEFVAWKYHDPLPLPEFMQARPSFPHELEAELKSSPFDTYPLFRGQKFGRSFLGIKFKSNHKQVGFVKVLIRIKKDKGTLSSSEQKEQAKQDRKIEALTQLMVPRPVTVRFYVLKCFNLIPMDVGGGKSDPYVKIKIGNNSLNDRKHYIKDSTDPGFYRMFEIMTMLPGPSQFKIMLMDYDTFTSDDLIGETIIDIEDRWFSDRWRGQFEDEGGVISGEEMIARDEAAERRTEEPDIYFRKPVELRSLWSKRSQQERGKLECWIDIMDQLTSLKYPKIDVSPPPPSEYEVRVIVWKTEDIPAFDFLTMQNDLFVRCSLGNNDKLWKETDTHWRAKNGKGSFNYRMKFPLQLPVSDIRSRLTLQVWDRDITKWSDCIAETVIDLSSATRAAYLHNAEEYEVYSDVRELEKHERQKATKVYKTKAVKVQPPQESQSTLLSNEAKVNIDMNTNGASDSSIENQQSIMPPDDEQTYLADEVDETSTEVYNATRLRSKVDKNREDHETRKGFHEYVAENAPWATPMLGEQTPPNSKAIPLVKLDTSTGDVKNMGKVYISVQLVRKDIAEGRLNNGNGRNEPNRFPKLPKPEGRLKWWKFWNPFYVLNECLGPQLARQCLCCFLILILILCLIFVFPQVSDYVTMVTSLSPPIKYTIVGILIVLILACCFMFFCNSLRCNCCTSSNDETGTESRCCNGCCRKRNDNRLSQLEMEPLGTSMDF